MSADKPPYLPKSAPKVRLSIVAGPGAGQTVELTRCVSLIGSRSGCKIQLKSPEISAVHCAIVNTGEDIYLRDLVSGSGTYLNALEARFETLEDGDTIRVGDWELRVSITAYVLDTFSDLPHVTLEPEPHAFGVQLNGSEKWGRLKRPVGLVGRREGCDIVINDRQISRAHLLLFTYRGEPVFCDLLSNNGVVLEGVRTRFSVLHSGDRLQVGEKTIRMVLPGVSRRKSGSSGQVTSMESSDQQSDIGSSGADRSDADRSGTVSKSAMDDTSDGTVVPVEDDDSDRIDIRIAEDS